MLQLGIVREIGGRYSARVSKGLRVVANLGTYSERKTLARSFVQNAQADQRIAEEVENLQQSGLARLEFADPVLTTLVETCRDIVAQRADKAERTGKGFFAQLLTQQDLEAQPCFMQTALNPHIIEVLSRAYGIVPYLETIELLSSFPSGPAMNRSQLWHIDRTDSVVVKQLIYINDVGDDEGPFTLVPRQESRKVPSFAPHYLSDELLAVHCDMGRLIRFHGSAGARALVDTGRCYHFGSRVRKPRHALFIYYNTGYGNYPRLGCWRGTFAEKLPLSNLQRKVIDI
jgi:hypothetical protein